MTPDMRKLRLIYRIGVYSMPAKDIVVEVLVKLINLVCKGFIENYPSAFGSLLSLQSVLFK